MKMDICFKFLPNHFKTDRLFFTKLFNEKDQIVLEKEILKHYLNQLKKNKLYAETYKDYNEIINLPSRSK